MMRGMAVPTMVWSIEASSMPRITETSTGMRRCRLSPAPALSGAGAAPAAGGPACVCTEACAIGLHCSFITAGGGRYILALELSEESVLIGLHGGDVREGLQAPRQGGEIVVAEPAQPGLHAVAPALAQPRHQLVALGGEANQGAPAVEGVLGARDQARLHQVLDQDAGGRLADAEQPR